MWIYLIYINKRNLIIRHGGGAAMKKLFRGAVEIAAALCVAAVVAVFGGGFGWKSAIIDGFDTVFVGGGTFRFTAMFLLLLAGGMAASVFLVKTKWIKWPLTGGLALTAGLVLAPAFLRFMVALSLSYETNDRQVINDGKLEIMELDKFNSFSGKENDKYYFKVLIKSPPKKPDSLKTLMVRYFYKKARDISALDPGSHLGSVHFYKYTQGNAGFTDGIEDHTGFYTNYLDKYPETKIGYISARNPCGNDSTKHYDVYIRRGGKKDGYENITDDTLYWGCGGGYEPAAAAKYKLLLAGQSGYGAPVSNCFTVAARKNAIQGAAAASPKDASPNPDDIAMVFVKGGPDNWTRRDTIGNFYICKYETTQGLWKSVMGTNPSYFTGDDNLPVEMVDWDDVQKFIEKLNGKTGKNYRLPTKKEWEYAAQGGKNREKYSYTGWGKIMDGEPTSGNNGKKYTYSGSDSIDQVAWYKGNSGGRTHPVGTKQPNELGIYDMSGNVYEWLADGGGKIRGGSWYFTADFCVASSYYSDYVSIPRNNFLGFRLARDAD